MEPRIVLGTLIVLALALAIGGGFVAARLLSHVAQQWIRATDRHDR